MKTWINYHHLLYFKTIAEEKSVSKAAEKLGLGQPTLSAQLKQLEDSLGTRLFEREKKKLILTEQGHVALEYARGIFAMGSEMLEAIHDRLKPAKPNLCIGALDSVPKEITLALVQAALKVSPCQVTLREGQPAELLRELSAHRLDLLLTDFIPNTREARALFHRVVTRKSVSLYGAPKFKALKKGFPRSIARQPMILPTYDSKLRSDLDHWGQVLDVDFDVVIESQDVAVKKLLALKGLGLLPAAAHSVTAEVRSGELVELGALSGTVEEIHLVSAQRKIENPIAKALWREWTSAG